MAYYDKYGVEYLDTIQNYIFDAIMPMMKDEEVLDLYIKNWAYPLNIGIYRDKLLKYIPSLIERLKSGLDDSEKKTIFGDNQAIIQEEQKQ